MSALLKKGLAALALTPLIAAAFVAVATAVFAIPNEPIVRHLTERPEVLLARRADNGRVIDADTECIGLSVGLGVGDPDPLVKRAVRAQSLYGCDPLMRFFAGSSTETLREYFRYWHGYLALARPALAVMPYNDLRGYLFTACAGLFGWLLWRIGSDFGAKTALAVAAPFVVINAMGFWVVATKAATWLLAVGAALYFSRRRPEPTPLLAFFILGALAAFFDFFTAPAFIFAFPALIFALYQWRGGAPAGWRDLFSLAVFWGAGWAGFILIKAAIAAAILDFDVWPQFVSAALFRLRGETDDVDSFIPGAALYENIAAMKSFWGPVAVLCFLILPFSTRERRRRWAALRRGRGVLLAIAAAPLLWLEVFSNHSQIHAAFTQINFAPFFMLGALVLAGAPALAATPVRAAAA